MTAKIVAINNNVDLKTKESILLADLKNNFLIDFIKLYKKNKKMNSFYKNDRSLDSDLSITNFNLMMKDFSLIYQFSNIVIGIMEKEGKINKEDNKYITDKIDDLRNEVCDVNIKNDDLYCTFNRDDLTSLIKDSYKYHSYFFEYFYPKIKEVEQLKYISLFKNDYIRNIEFINHFLFDKIEEDRLIDISKYNLFKISKINTFYLKFKYNYLKSLSFRFFN
jgi:hypothetical protein